MPRLSRNARSAAMVRSAGPGNYVDGNGLMLRVRRSGTRQWIQRLTIHGQRVDLGLGSAELVKLADARRVAADNRAIARTGGDPRRSRVPTFAKAEAICFAEKRTRGARTARRSTGARRWTATCCRGSAACRWTRWAARRSTRCCGRSRWRASTRRSRWRGRRSRRFWSGRGSTSSAPRARRWRPWAAEARRGPQAPRRRAVDGGGRRAGADRRGAVPTLDEASDAVHGGDGGPGGGGAAGDLGPVRR